MKGFSYRGTSPVALLMSFLLSVVLSKHFQSDENLVVEKGTARNWSVAMILKRCLNESFLFMFESQKEIFFAVDL